MKNNIILKFICLSISSLFLFQPNTGIAQNCNCTEYVYLNEAKPGVSETYKFEINPADGSLTEILNSTTGGPWADDVTNEPHGLGFDMAGFVYIGNVDGVTIPNPRGVDRYRCDGTVDQFDYFPPGPADGTGTVFGYSTNYYIVNGILYTNNWSRSGFDDTVNDVRNQIVFAYDVCSGVEIGRYTVCGVEQWNWDMHIDEATNTMYINVEDNRPFDAETGGVAIVDLDADLNGACVPLTIQNSTGALGPGATGRGIVMDSAGNIYRRGSNILAKYDANGNLICSVDLTLSGGSRGWGMAYSETTGYLYLGANDVDCISIYDTNCNYVAQGLVNANPPPPGNNTFAKALQINTECCPVNPMLVVDTIVCTADISNGSIYLQDLIACDGVVCEGNWSGGGTDLAYDACESKATVNSAGSCETFTLLSDGAGPSAQCGAFMITVNLCVEEVSPPAISITNNNCEPVADGSINVDAGCTNGTLEWSTDRGVSWSATAPTYSTDGVIVRARCITTNGCVAETADLATLPRDCNKTCNCNEYVYLNETDPDGAVRKFLVNTDGTFLEIGAPWYDSADWPVQDQLTSPHGLGTDLNGFIYIGSTFNNPADIRKLTCNGEKLPETEFVIPTTGQFNIVSIGNRLYVNDRYVPEHIAEYDLCTGAFTGSVEFCEADFDSSADWGLYANTETGEIYVTQGFRGNLPNYLYYFTQADFDTDPNTCISSSPLDPQFPVLDADVRGVVTDADGNVYIAVFNDNNTPSPSSYLMKFGPAPTFNYIATSALDSLEDGTGYRFIIGLVYSETTNLIYASTQSFFDDCVSAFDTDLNYLGTVVPSPGDDIAAKGIAIQKECCPNTNIQTIDEVFCFSGTQEVLFINELYECEGAICEGIPWELESADSSITYEDCDQSITVNGVGCATFTKVSNGVGNNLQCEAFNITINVCYESQPTAPVISITDNTCNPDVAGSINVDTPCASGTLEWSTDGGVSWSATQPVYDDVPVTVTARCTNSCGSAETAAIASVPEECCPPQNCIRQFGEFTIIKNSP